MTKVKRKRLSDVVEKPVVKVQQPQHNKYPTMVVFEMALQDIDDILRGDSVVVRLPELGRAIWEVMGVLACWKWGNPDIDGSCPKHDPALMPKLASMQQLLGMAKARAQRGYTPLGATMQMSAGSGSAMNEQIVLLDSCLRTIRCLQTACAAVGVTGTQDTMI